MTIQPPTPWVSFSRYAAIRFRGEDARAFLQTQLTQDIRLLVGDNVLVAAWLSVKGRVLATLVLLEESSTSILAITLASRADLVCAQLKRFVLRAKVNIEVAAELVVAARMIDAQQTPFALTRRQDALGFSWGDRAIKVVPETLAPAPADDRFAMRWQLLGVRAQFPDIEPGAEDLFVPQALGLDRWNALSFQKGCYPGQEIVARLHFLGRHKRHLRHLRADQVLALRPGIALHHPDSLDSEPEAVVVLSATGETATEVLAVLKDSANFPLAIAPDDTNLALTSPARFMAA